MTRPTDSEWMVLDTLWQGGHQTLGHIYDTLTPQTGWSRTTVHTYLTRMEKKGLIATLPCSPKKYYATLSRQEATSQERQSLLTRHGSLGNLVAAFAQDGTLTQEERNSLRTLLDEMEV